MEKNKVLGFRLSEHMDDDIKYIEEWIKKNHLCTPTLTAIINYALTFTAQYLRKKENI